MTCLRARIVATRVLSMICVVVVSTATLFWAREGHEQKEQHEYAKLVSEGILLIAPFFGDNGNENGAHLRSSAVPGAPRPELTNVLQSELRDAESDLEIVVAQPPETTHPLASITFRSGSPTIPIID